ncbi:MAG: 2-dehydropantoate 2-reductase [Propionibacteriaceae bacterium]|jgi:2-dehydropantoate 2-reductase|nr:2-dehydropantoate 2-reductase [Propionibacteriaceae bacterium]
MDVAIIGAGAIGGYYGARLAHGGHTVHFLAHSEYDHLKAHGLRVDSVEGDFSIPANELHVYNDVVDMPPCDLVCVATKATANDDVLPILWPVMKPDGVLLVMQNGFGIEQQLAARHARVHIFSGLCFICAFREGPGHVRHTAYGAITLAPLNPDDQVRLGQLEHLLTAAGLEVSTQPDVVTARFRKLVWNIPFNGLSVVLDATTKDLAESPAADRLVRALMAEVVEAAAACGVTIDAGFIDEMAGSVAGMAEYSPSMRLDYLAHRPLEIDALYRNVAAYAKDHGYTMARTEQLADELDYLQARYLV